MQIYTVIFNFKMQTETLVTLSMESEGIAVENISESVILKILTPSYIT